MNRPRRPVRLVRLGRRVRCGASTYEAVISTGITLPLAAALFFLGRAACGRLYQIIESLVAWPYL